MVVIKEWSDGRYDKEIAIYDSDMPFTCLFRQTGSYGMYCTQRRHRWIGIKGIWGVRFSCSW